MTQPKSDGQSPSALADLLAPIRVQLRRTKGWRMPPNTVKVTRPGPWGNPFNFRSSEFCWLAISYGCRADPAGRQEASVRAFREWIAPGYGLRTASMERGMAFRSGRKSVAVGPRIFVGEAPPLRDIRAALAGKNLACWCALGAPCHADVLLELANASPVDDATDRQAEPREDPDRPQPIKPKTHNHSGKGAEDVG